MSTNANNGGAPGALLQAILDPRALESLDAPHWERLLSCARRNAVLAYLAERAATAGIFDDLPEYARSALLAAKLSAARLAQLARWELDRVRRALQPAGIPIVALKGVAYILRGMPHASTRLLADIDIMVPRDRIADAERELMTAGWQGTILDPYDQRYYRDWSHEIPPLLYPGRLLEVDVHHTICPPLSRLRPDPERFWARAEPSGEGDVRLLSPVDSVLHAVVHLFFDSDFNGRFRDLLDLHELLSAFAVRGAFWEELLAEAKQQGLGRPLYYAFASLRRVLGTNIPQDAVRDIEQFKPSPVVDRWMTATLATVLTPADPEQWPPAHRGRLWLLYIRSHWTRMPVHLLVPHLTRKSIRRARTASVDA